MQKFVEIPQKHNFTPDFNNSNEACFYNEKNVCVRFEKCSDDTIYTEIYQEKSNQMDERCDLEHHYNASEHEKFEKDFNDIMKKYQ